MKYLCLAYGSEKDWNALTKSQQEALLAQDEVLRRQGNLVAAVAAKATTLQAWDGTPATTKGPLVERDPPLAGFAIVEAENLDEALRLLTNTPCARAKGAIEIRPITIMNTTRVEGVEPT